MSTIQILNRETLSDKKYRLQNIKFEKPDLQGKMHDQENEVYFKPDAVTVLLADEKLKTFLLTKQFRLPTFLNGSDSGYLVEPVPG
jgi:GDP-mannose pyrophosphatase NudK